MKGQVKAIALCRVSSDEQLKNNSLARQNKSVHEMANKIGAVYHLSIFGAGVYLVRLEKI